MSHESTLRLRQDKTVANGTSWDVLVDGVLLGRVSSRQQSVGFHTVKRGPRRGGQRHETVWTIDDTVYDGYATRAEAVEALLRRTR